MRRTKNNFISSLDELKKQITITKDEEEALKKVIKMHPMKITKYYLSLINPKDKNDPIRKMIIPSVEELNTEGEYDTSGEKTNTKKVGLQHKYSETALILSTNRCAAYCRYCFRKRLIGLPTKEISNRFDDSVDYIKKHKEIDNVLITGGDPFFLSTKMIISFLNKLTPIKHLKFIRFGTRIPVVFPQRIYQDKQLLKFLKTYSKEIRQVYIVTHFNHPREITKESIKAISSLKEAGLIVNNQTVLLKGVNDDPKILADLMKNLVRIGVNPYYLFQCRPVRRVKNHFQISLEKGYKIVEEAKKMLDGHSKRFKYIISHKTGKIEIVGILGKEIYFKYHQAKDPKNSGKFFKKKLEKNTGWLD